MFLFSGIYKANSWQLHKIISSDLRQLAVNPIQLNVMSNGWVVDGVTNNVATLSVPAGTPVILNSTRANTAATIGFLWNPRQHRSQDKERREGKKCFH